MARTILWTSSNRPLATAHYLGDYEAIVVDLEWGSLIGANGLVSGQDGEATDEFVRETTNTLDRRAKELEPFLSSGGVLVVKVQPPSVLWSADYQGRTGEVDTTRWLVSNVYPLQYAVVLGEPPFVAGSGRRITLREFGHPLEAVIRNANGYTGRIAKLVFDLDDPVLLAVTRIGDPVAAEIPVGDGLVFLILSGVSDKQLEVALNEILAARERYRQNWLLPEEAALIGEQKAVQVQAREKVASLAKRSQELADVKASVMKRVDMQRAIGYYENGTSATRPIKQAMVDLYKLVELLEGYFGGSEDKLASRLDVPKTLFKHIKKLANQRQLDFRHATSGETEGADVKEVEQARDDARALVQRFVEQCCAEAEAQLVIASDAGS